ncbi:MAG: GtrA family protein [Actinomycetota bacterium]|nr:GtrA family protein [Actinomycetota bacterium]
MRDVHGTGVRFGLVGVANTTVDLVLFTVLSVAGVPLVVANLASTSAGMALSFVLNRRFTFRAGSGSPLRQVLLFLLVNAVVLWVVQPLVILAVSAALADVLPVTAALVTGKALALVVGVSCNYLLYSRLVFRPRPAVASVR